MLFACGVPLLAWSGISLVSRAVSFAEHGVPRTAVVLDFLNISGTPRSGYTLYYVLDIDGAQQTNGFRVRLSEGTSVPVLVSPRDPQEVVIGRSDDSWLQIFRYEMGGGFLGYAVLLFYPLFFFVLLPLSVRGLWQARRRGAFLRDFAAERERRPRVIT